MSDISTGTRTTDTQINIVGYPGDSAGSSLGASATDLVGAYGKAAAQESGPDNAAIVGGQAGGIVVTYASTQSPTSVLTITTTEKSMTVQSGTGAVVVPATGDLFFINKPSAQAGLGMGNIRFSSAGVVGVTFSNFTPATITPTGSESYGIVMIRGIPSLSATLSPAPVLPNTITEQVFTVAGIRENTLVQVSKPTAQAGLDIGNVRALPGDNQVGITFINVTAATLTPTAAESYSFLTLGNINSSNNLLVAQVNILSALAAGVATITVSAIAAIPVGNLAVTDTIIGVTKDTAQAGLGYAGYRVSSAGNLAIDWVNPTVATLTPTASHVYGVSLMRPAPMAPLKIYTQTLTPTSVAANTTAEQTFTVPGLIASTPVFVNCSNTFNGVTNLTARVSSANTMAITYGNVTAGALVPNSCTYVIGNFQMPIDSTAGNSWIQDASPTVYQAKTLTNTIRSMLVATGWMKGS